MLTMQLSTALHYLNYVAPPPDAPCCVISVTDISKKLQAFGRTVLRAAFKYCKTMKNINSQTVGGNGDRGTALARLCRYTTEIVMASDKKHMISTNRKYTPVEHKDTCKRWAKNLAHLISFIHHKPGSKREKINEKHSKTNTSKVPTKA